MLLANTYRDDPLLLRLTSRAAKSLELLARLDDDGPQTILLELRGDLIQPAAPCHRHGGAAVHQGGWHDRARDHRVHF
eukprot:8055622-Pyramimonas_sp.AAC.1